MHERDHKDGHARTSKRRKRMWLAAISLILLAIGGWFLRAVVFPRDSRTADERLAEIEAARAIPESENAATIYNQLLQDPNATSVMDDFPESPAGDVLGRVLRKPWRSKDLPELAGWVKGHQYIIDRLLDGARFEKCTFPISIDIGNAVPIDRLASMREWGYLLTIAANNDVAEGQIDVALTKWRCLAQVDNHLHQQPTHMDHLTGMSMMRFAWESAARFIVEGAPTETYLQEIETIPVETTDHTAAHLREVREIDDLIRKKVTQDFGPFGRLQYRFLSHVAFRGLRMPDTQASLADLHLRHTATARGICILITLRRHKNATGHWPASLDEIKSSLPVEVLTDPLNHGPFVYTLTSDSFRLYSKGQNGIDEDGRTRQGENFERLEDDLALWPLPVPEPEAPMDEETRKKQLEEIYGPDPN